MSNSTAADRGAQVLREERQIALRRAWWAYGAIFVTPLVVLAFSGFLVSFGVKPAITSARAEAAFILNLVWVGVVGTASFFLQEYYFSRYFKGRTVTPRDWLHGKLAVWAGLGSGAVIAVTLIWMSQSYAPHSAALLIAYVLLGTQYPRGNALVSHAGASEKASVYAEPK